MAGTAVGISGLWYDRSRPAVLGATLTLPVDQAYYLLTSLTLLITIAGASFWNLTALLLHRLLAANQNADVLDLEHRVAVLNLGTSAKVFLSAIKLYHAWLRKGVRNLEARTLLVLVPAGLVWSTFVIASILASRVAITDSNGDVISPIRPDRCGFFSFDVPENETDPFGMMRKIPNDTIQARNYASSFYNRASTSRPTLSRFKSITLPMDIDTAAGCPFRNPDRCRLGPNGAMAMRTGLLNSHDAFGINSHLADQVAFQYEATCSPVRPLDGEVKSHVRPGLAGDINRNVTRAYFGPYGDGQVYDDFTYEFYDETINTQAGYIVQSYYAMTNDAKPPTWVPIPDFNRTDADVTMLFLSQNKIAYLEPTLDPWFWANGSYRVEINGLNLTLANRYFSVMACTEQFRLCNPAREISDACLPWTGLMPLQRALVENDPVAGGLFNVPQMLIAQRILSHMTLSTLHYSVVTLRGASLWANDLVYGNISPRLPDNQWQVEALGWFQISLAKLQSYIVQFAANSDDLGPYGRVISPLDMLGTNGEHGETSNAAYQVMQDQCSNQLVRTTGEMQNFSFLGVMVIVLFSCTVIVLDLAGGVIMEWLRRLLRRPSALAAARQADNIFHLVRLALRAHLPHGERWVLGHWEVPVWEGDLLIPRPYIEENGGLALYPDPSRVENHVSKGHWRVGEAMRVEEAEMDSLEMQDTTEIVA